MRAGVLRNSIEIQSSTQIGKTALNEPIYEWALWREVFAGIESRRGAEHFDTETKQRFVQEYFRFRCRYSDVDGVQAGMRILFEDKYYDIQNTLPDYQKRDDVLIDARLLS